VTNFISLLFVGRDTLTSLEMDINMTEAASAASGSSDHGPMQQEPESRGEHHDVGMASAAKFSSTYRSADEGEPPAKREPVSE